MSRQGGARDRAKSPLQCHIIIQRLSIELTQPRLRSQVVARFKKRRDLDVSIKPYRTHGFTIDWISVTRGPDGERVGPDVKRRAVAANFVPSLDLDGV